MKVINLYGGPGTGKSTTAASLFAHLKLSGYNTEMSREFAKDLVWAGRSKELRDPYYIFGEQHHRLWLLKRAGVSVAVCDSPLPQSMVYAYDLLTPDRLSKFSSMVLSVHAQYDNLDVFLRRSKGYNPSGRVQTESEAADLDVKILRMLDTKGIEYVTVPADQYAHEDIMAEFEGYQS